MPALNPHNIKVILSTVLRCPITDIKVDSMPFYLLESTLRSHKINNEALQVIAEKLPLVIEYLRPTWVIDESYSTFWEHVGNGGFERLVALADNIQTFAKYMTIGQNVDISATHNFIIDLVNPSTRDVFGAKITAERIVNLAGRLEAITPTQQLLQLIAPHDDSVSGIKLWNTLSIISETSVSISSPAIRGRAKTDPTRPKLS